MREVGRLHAAIIDANASSGFYISARGLFARKMRAQRSETEAAQIAKGGHPVTGAVSSIVMAKLREVSLWASQLRMR